MLENLNIYFDFYSIASLTPVFFMGVMSFYILSINNKSKATLHVGIGYLYLTLFFLAYFFAFSVYNQIAAFHRWITVLAAIGGTFHFWVAILNFPNLYKKRTSKTILIIGYSITTIILIVFIKASLSSDIVYHFRGHYWDFDEEKISTIVGLMIALEFTVCVVFGVFRLFKDNQKDKWIPFFLSLGIFIGPIIPAVANIMSRNGLLDRGTYQMTQDIATIMSFFVVAILFINYTKDKTTILTKILGISIAAFLIIFQWIILYVYNNLDSNYDALHQSKTANYISSEKFDENVKYVIQYSDNEGFEKLKFVGVNTFDNYDDINFEDKKIELQNTKFVERISNFTEIDSIKKYTSQSDCYSILYKLIANNVLSKTEINDFEKIFKEEIIKSKRLLIYSRTKIETMPEENFKENFIKFLPKSKLQILNPFLENFVDTTSLEKAELKKEILKYFLEANYTDERCFARRHDGEKHYIAYRFYDENTETIYEIGFPYLNYRKYMHEISIKLTAILLILMATVILGFPLFFRKSLIIPIKNILSGLTQIRDGKLDTQIPVKVKDEFGIISEDFNKMASTIKDATENLEQKVKERTAEIQQQKEEIETQSEQLMFINSELEKLSIIASETDNAVSVFDNKGNITYINASFERIYGYNLEEFKQKYGRNILKTSKSKNIFEIIKTCYRNKETVIYETENITKSENTIWVQTTLTPILDKNGEISQLIAIDADISKMKMAEQEIKQQNEEILAQKDLLEQRNEEIVAQKEKVEEQNKHINDSIRYAQTIQYAILPNQEEINHLFENFIIFKPKDIVSGDFYWFLHNPKLKFIFAAVVDCTGHGVPGAFMSMIGSRLLNEIVNEKQIYSPADILTELNKNVHIALKQDETQNTDGMDVCLVKIDYNDINNNFTTFAGAKRPLYWYNFEQKELITVKGTRRTIGGVKVRNEVIFEDNILKTKQGDLLYLSSDGIIDQNAPDRKRFGTPKFLEILNKSAQNTMTGQRAAILAELRDFQNNEPQRDDITIMCLKF